MRIALLSCDGREDIVAGFMKFAEKFWPTRTWPIESIVGDPEGSYCTRLLSYFRPLQEEIIMMAIDDHWPYPVVDNDTILRAYAYMLAHPHIGAIHLLPCTSTGNDCPDLEGFRYITIQDSDRGCNGAYLVSRKYIIEMAELLTKELTPAQDEGIVGMTNWELSVNRLGAHWTILCPSPDRRVFGRINACGEAEWKKSTIDLAKETGIDFDFSKRPLYDGKNPHWHKWNAAR